MPVNTVEVAEAIITLLRFTMLPTSNQFISQRC